MGLLQLVIVKDQFDVAFKRSLKIINYLVLSLLIFTGALKDTLDLQLVGPFEILAGAHRNSKNPQPNFHLHWRHFYDPPEFQTVLQGSEDSQHHMGYYRYGFPFTSVSKF